MPRKGENIRKRKDGRWEARYEKCRDQNGRIQYGYLYGRTYEAVKKKKLAILCQNNLQNSPGKCYVFRNLSEEWMLSMRYAVKLSTYACYETLLDTHILPEFGDMPLKYILTCVYTLIQWAVPVFLMISGNLLLHSNKLAFTKVKKMSLRMGAVLLLFGSAFALLEQVFERKTLEIGMLPNSVLMTLQQKSWSHLWYLYILIGIYLILIPLKRFIDNSSNREELISESILKLK